MEYEINVTGRCESQELQIRNLSSQLTELSYCLHSPYNTLRPQRIEFLLHEKFSGNAGYCSFVREIATRIEMNGYLT